MTPIVRSWVGVIDPRDRNLLVGCALLVAILVLALAILKPAQEDDKDPTPYSDSTGRWGAKAAFELLRKEGYQIERQHAPLSEIVARIDEHSTLVIAAPFMQNTQDGRATIKEALDRGARVLVTGPTGAMLVPEGSLDDRTAGRQTACEGAPNGFGELANSGVIEMPAPLFWQRSKPLPSVEYTCQGNPIVVRYNSGKGVVIWWASSFPLQNGGLDRANNLALFLNSIGPPSNHVIWDESLHGDVRSLWSYAAGTPIYLVWGQLALVALLLILSFSRRGGPLRPDPVVSRATPLEFVHSLGSLYQRAGATQVAVTIGYQRFRHQLEKQFAVAKSLSAESPALLQALTSRFPADAATIREHLLACEHAGGAESLTPREALQLVQALHDDQPWK